LPGRGKGGYILEKRELRGQCRKRKRGKRSEGTMGGVTGKMARPGKRGGIQGFRKKPRSWKRVRGGTQRKTAASPRK